MSRCQKSRSVRQPPLEADVGEGGRSSRLKPEVARGRGPSEADGSVAVFHPSGKGQDAGGGKAEKTLADFAAEYAKSSRSTCKGCLEKIEKVGAGAGAARVVASAWRGARGSFERAWVSAQARPWRSDVPRRPHGRGLVSLARAATWHPGSWVYCQSRGPFLRTDAVRGGRNCWEALRAVGLPGSVLGGAPRPALLVSAPGREDLLGVSVSSGARVGGQGDGRREPAPFKTGLPRGAWAAPSGERLTSAQVVT